MYQLLFVDVVYDEFCPNNSGRACVCAAQFIHSSIVKLPVNVNVVLFRTLAGDAVIEYTVDEPSNRMAPRFVVTYVGEWPDATVLLTFAMPVSYHTLLVPGKLRGSAQSNCNAILPAVIVGPLYLAIYTPYLPRYALKFCAICSAVRTVVLQIWIILTLPIK